ncbi:PetM family of cytochrome b6f complex subunit 7 [Bosea sp. 124]|uniref:PetM family of cytochrome b6f complex subunit 7 n=1 Tax=Bosea sp. 124 TaxID=2135642 RepID=UPI000D3C1764|nr:PetM family of cytochrome b6f complex subunit 7 [Bosea sp. 124]PTM39988.1 hypothetical protein C8D03_1498 [Bosea sp. 124]
MVRFLLRLLGYLLVAAGFVSLVIDGARSIANSALQYTPLELALSTLVGERIKGLQPMIERGIHPLLWDPVILSLMLAPAALIAFLLGFLLLRLGAPPEPKIGIVTRR